MPPRLHVDAALAATPSLTLPPAAARHAQVLRLQPGAALTLFDGRGGEWQAEVAAMSKRDVQVRVSAHRAVERELPVAVTLALAMPAGERMDFIVEKATELGATAVQPLIAERSVLRLSAERADKRRAHWQAVAVAACEQCGRNRVPVVQPPQPLAAWLGTLGPRAPQHVRWLLAWREALPWPQALAAAQPLTHVLTLSGPEGGFSDDEQALAATQGFAGISLGPRVLRADTAPLALLAALSLQSA